MCPAYVSLGRNMVYVPYYHEYAQFLVSSLTKISDDGFSVQGDPMASYAVPPTPILSSFPPGKYEMRGGVMRGRCKVVEARTGLGVKVQVGTITWYDWVNGALYLADLGAPGAGPDEGRGWGFLNNQSSTNTGWGPQVRQE